MKSLIIYGSRVKLTNAHKLVTSRMKPPTGEAQPEYFVRVKVVNTDFETALYKHARPMSGETVLNTVPIE